MRKFQAGGGAEGLGVVVRKAQGTVVRKGSEISMYDKKFLHPKIIDYSTK